MQSLAKQIMHAPDICPVHAVLAQPAAQGPLHAHAIKASNIGFEAGQMNCENSDQSGSSMTTLQAAHGSGV